jgi:hypothetical protein
MEEKYELTKDELFYYIRIATSILLETEIYLTPIQVKKIFNWADNHNGDLSALQNIKGISK